MAMMGLWRPAAESEAALQNSPVQVNSPSSDLVWTSQYRSWSMNSYAREDDEVTDTETVAC